MPRSKSVYIKWTYGPNYQSARVLPDPRIAIARQMQWTRGSGHETFYSLPEPDNYNRAVFTEQPIECPFIRDQVIYRSEPHRGWFTVCLVPRHQVTDFESWAGQHALALWTHSKPAALKHSKRLLERRDYYKEISTNERLLLMGYYKNFAVKYFQGDTAIVKSRVGEPRGELINFVNDDEETTL